ncbi:response regulator [Paenibacillus illinoisensis]|uniref:response regulator transcription factor n=1 Tax=Paenibacillus illinoisensis TaxID=59845 RepID=UPI003CEA23A1
MKALLVDDEPLTLESLRKYVTWDELGIDELESANNGKEALELVKHFKPQIVVSDVRMPRMNGIEFATRLRETYPDSKIIFLSGYSDKEYLKSAIELRAVRYVEKPVKLDELTLALRESIFQYKLEQQTRNVTRDFMEQQWISNWTQLQSKSFSFESNECPPSYAFMKSKILPVAILAASLGDNVENIDLASNDLVHWVREHVSHCSIAGRVKPRIILAILPADDLTVDVHTERAALFLQELQHQYGSAFDFSIGLGSIVETDFGFIESIQKAMDMSHLAFYKGYRRVYSGNYELTDQSEIAVLDEELFNRFRMNLRNEQEQQACHNIEQQTSVLRQVMDYNTQRVAGIYFHYLLALHEFAMDKGLAITDSHQERTFIWKEIDEVTTLEGMHGYVIDNVKAVFAQWKAKHAVGARVSEIYQFIQDHYHLSHLTTRMISEYAYLSQTYLCALFKKETGKTINEHITEVRIAKAKELLQDHHMKLYEIAAKIGLTDANYFSSMFKKATGLTPTQYREKL